MICSQRRSHIDTCMMHYACLHQEDADSTGMASPAGHLQQYIFSHMGRHIPMVQERLVACSLQSLRHLAQLVLA